tara:strand:- start:639 stop:872 length:234 start_codon:yes stop_codon:yes gene_type:complete
MFDRMESQNISSLLHDVKGYVYSIRQEMGTARVHSSKFGGFIAMPIQLNSPATITIEQNGKVVTFISNQDVFKESNV